MSLAGIIAGPSAHDPPFFNDVHSLLQNVMGELTRMREAVDSNDAEQQTACDQLRKDIEQECHESRENMNKFRYEFDELVHRRVETVVEGLEEMEQAQRFKDRHQQRQIDTLQSEVDNLVANLGGVSKAWRRIKHNSKESQRIVKDIAESQQLERFTQRANKANNRRRSSLQEVIGDIARRKEESDTFNLAEQVRARLKGAAQFLHGEDWERALRDQDADGSGQISYEEFKVMCRTELRLQDSDSAFRLIFDCLDADGSGEVSLQEMAEFVDNPANRMRSRLKRAAIETGNDWRKLIEEQDPDNSGQISFAGFRRLCHRRLKLPEKDFNLISVFRAVDADHSGTVSIRELTAWVEGRK
mmetsp:Transcript_33656/g.104496  ORF Transcript_33656/g.104496 Transcript_33656/m.104496 type:complete len:358 (+) Transcript_33656:79-1152(+)